MCEFGTIIRLLSIVVKTVYMSSISWTRPLMLPISTKSPLLNGLLTSICIPLANCEMLLWSPMPAVIPAAPMAAMKELRLNPRVEQAESITAKRRTHTTIVRRKEWTEASTFFFVSAFIRSLPMSDVIQNPTAMIIAAPASLGSASRIFSAIKSISSLSSVCDITVSPFPVCTIIA